MEVVVTMEAIRRASQVIIVIITQTNQHPAFYRSDALSVTQPTVSKHWGEELSEKSDQTKTPESGLILTARY